MCRTAHHDQAAIDTVRSLKASPQDRRASYDLAQKKLRFTLERDIETAVQDVRDKLAGIVNQFPRDTMPL